MLTASVGIGGRRAGCGTSGTREREHWNRERPGTPNMGHDDLRALTESQALSATGENAAPRHRASGNLGLDRVVSVVMDFRLSESSGRFLLYKSLDRAVLARTIQRKVKLTWLVRSSEARPTGNQEGQSWLNSLI